MADPIHFPGHLPAGALVQRLRPVPGPAAQDPQTLPQTAPRPEPSGPPAPVWLSCDHSPGITPLHLWPSASGAAAASVPANETGTRRNAAGALIFQSGVNAGFCLSDAVPDGPAAMAAAIFRPMAGAAAGTILSLQPKDGSGYLFLAHEDGQLRLGHKDGDLALVAPAPDGVILAALALQAGRVHLIVNGRNAASAPLTLARPADLYIGCRNARPGLRNKLGSFHLFDVLVWPEDGHPDLGAALALRNGRERHGL